MGWQYKVVAEIRIEAAPVRVWEILTDFARYDEWNPMLTEMSGAAEVGNRLRFTVTDARGARRRMGGVVHEAFPARRLEWRGGTVLTFRGHHFFELEPDGEGTLLRHGEAMWGIGPLLLRRVLKARAAPLYPALNEALKRYIEKQVM